MENHSVSRYHQRKDMVFEVPDTKKCSTCQATKPGTEYKREVNNRDGLKGECNECFRNRILVRKYGITASKYDIMNEEQNGVCAVCKRECPTGRALAVDHCHTTSRVRGLLCSKCNRGIGMFDDNTDSLRAAIEYLEETKT